MNTFFYKTTPKGVIRVIGEDAEDYLQSQWSINLRKLPKGGIRYGLRLSTKGKVLADSYFLRLCDEEFMLVSKECEGAEILSLLNENIVADEVEFINETQNWELITLWNEAKNSDLTLSNLVKPEKNQFSAIEDGFYFEDLRAFPNALSILLPIGTKWKMDPDVKSKSKNDYEQLRIRAGEVSIPTEIGSDDLPQEGKLENNAVDFDKGCYLGQEVMARIHAMGRVRRQARPVSWPCTKIPALPCSLFDGEKKVGILKTLVQTEQGNSIGIALIHEKGLDTLNAEGLGIDGFTDPKIKNA
jgi:folate-binding protein YgfZ